MTISTYVHVWWKRGQSHNLYDEIDYNPKTGKIYSIYYSQAAGGRRYSLLGTQSLNVDPRVDTESLSSLSEVSVAGNVVNLEFIPTRQDINETPYTHFALETVPGR